MIVKRKLKLSDAILGIDVGGTNIKGSLVKNGKAIKSLSIPTKADSSRKVIVDRIYQVVDSIFTKNVKGIGFGFPAPIEGGLAREINNIPNLNGFDIKKEIEKKYKVKCAVENDAKCFTYAQAKYGQGKGKSIVCGVTLGTGLGVGVVIENKILTGKNGVLGELSRIPYRDSILEDYTSGKFFLRNYRQGPKEVMEFANAGHAKALKAYEEFGRYLGDAVAIIVAAYDPDIIIFGGKISQSYDLFSKTMFEKAKMRMFKRSFDRLTVKVTKMRHSSEKGAAALFFQ